MTALMILSCVGMTITASVALHVQSYAETGITWKRCSLKYQH